MLRYNTYSCLFAATKPLFEINWLRLSYQKKAVVKKIIIMYMPHSIISSLSYTT